MYIVFKYEQVDVYENSIEQTGDIISVVVYQNVIAEFTCLHEVERFTKDRQDLSVYDVNAKKFIDDGSIEVNHWEK